MDAPEGTAAVARSPDDVVSSCFPLANHSLLNTDCDDTDSLIEPSRTERCDGVDNNCDGQNDEGLDCIAPCTSDLFFSEYFENEGNLKALEITNLTGGAVDLADYAIKSWANVEVGESWDDAITSLLSSTKTTLRLSAIGSPRRQRVAPNHRLDMRPGLPLGGKSRGGRVGGGQLFEALHQHRTVFVLGSQAI